MLALLSYLITVALIIFSSLSVVILCAVKLYQSRHGSTNHKITSSDGLIRRNQIIMAICITNGTRCIFSCVEFILFATNVVKEDKPIDSISYYIDLGGLLPRVLLVSRVFPTILFFGYNCLIGDYFATLFFTIRDLEYGVYRIFFSAANIIVVCVIFAFLLFAPNPSILNELCLIEVAMLGGWIIRYTYGVNQFYIRNEDVVLEASSSHVNQNKLLARMCRVVTVALVALFVYALMYCADLVHILPNRDFYARSAIDLSTVLLSEVGCSWLLVSLFSNGLVSMEGRLRDVCGSVIGRIARGRQEDSVGCAAGGESESVSESMMPRKSKAQHQRQLRKPGTGTGMGGIHKTNADADLHEAQRLQQDKLLLRYGNYQSIPLSADDNDIL